MHMLETLKVFLNIDDDLQDDLLRQIIDDMTNLVLGYTGQETLPPALEWVVRELAIIRFNRIGSEGMQSESEEGKRMDFQEDPLLNYYGVLDHWIVTEEKGEGGKAKFI